MPEEIAILTHILALLHEQDRRYTERFHEQEKATAAAFLASKDAVSKAEIATEKRFDAANEFRAQLTDQAATFMPRNEHQTLYDALTTRIVRLEVQDSAQAGKTLGIAATIGYIIAVIAVTASIVTLVVSLR